MPQTPDRGTATARAAHAGPSGHMKRRGDAAAPALVLAMRPGLAACGGSSNSHTTSTPSTTVPPAPAIRATLTAPTHTPKVNAPWHDVVRVTNGAGHPVPAVVHLQAMFQGVAVGQIGLHKVSNGVWSETINWPAASVGQALVFQALATALGTTLTIDYPLQVAPA